MSCEHRAPEWLEQRPQAACPGTAVPTAGQELPAPGSPPRAPRDNRVPIVIGACSSSEHDYRAVPLRADAQHRTSACIPARSSGHEVDLTAGRIRLRVTLPPICAFSVAGTRGRDGSSTTRFARSARSGSSGAPGSRDRRRRAEAPVTAVRRSASRPFLRTEKASVHREEGSPRALATR